MNAFRTRTWWAVIVAICFLAPLLHADSITFKNGQTLQGKYLGGTDSQVTFYTDNQLKHYAVSDIDSITFGGDTSTSSAAAAAPAEPAPAPVMQAPPATADSASCRSSCRWLAALAMSSLRFCGHSASGSSGGSLKAATAPRRQPKLPRHREIAQAPTAPLRPRMQRQLNPPSTRSGAPANAKRRTTRHAPEGPRGPSRRTPRPSARSAMASLKGPKAKAKVADKIAGRRESATASTRPSRSASWSTRHSQP